MIKLLDKLKKSDEPEQEENAELIKSRLSVNRQKVHDIKEQQSDAFKPNYAQNLFNKKDEYEAGEEKEDDMPPESNPLDRLRRNVIKNNNEEDVATEKLDTDNKQSEEKIKVDDELNMKEVTKIVKIVKAALKDDESKTEQKKECPRPVNIPKTNTIQEMQETSNSQFMPEEYVKRKSMFEHMLNIVIVLITLFTILVICRAFLCDLMIVDGNSMTPTYTDSQMVFVNKIKYQITSPVYGDIVIIKKDGTEDYIIKRIVACPGDTVYISNGKIYVNNTESQYNYDKMAEAGIASEEIRLGDDEYFVLGDNRNQSTDSRSKSVGIINKDEIKGEVKADVPGFLKIFANFSKKSK